MRRLALSSAIRDTLALLGDDSERPTKQSSMEPATLPLSLPSLLAQCRQMIDQAGVAESPTLRTVHHFACTGGTLISRCLAAQPNVRLLSEVDPLSRLRQGGRENFFPSDLPSLARAGSRPPDDETIQRVFLAGLSVILNDSRRCGLDLVLRDHAHSHFCVGGEFSNRPSLRDMLSQVAPLLSVVTVRHPFDSWLALRKWRWTHFSPTTAEEYARRYHAFLDHHAGLEILRYEDFLIEPEKWMMWLCERLALSYSSDFPYTFAAIMLSGNSGRHGDRIAPRPRRSHTIEMAEEAFDSTLFTRLLGRLDYDMSLV